MLKLLPIGQTLEGERPLAGLESKIQGEWPLEELLSLRLRLGAYQFPRMSNTPQSGRQTIPQAHMCPCLSSDCERQWLKDGGQVRCGEQSASTSQTPHPEGKGKGLMS